MTVTMTEPDVMRGADLAPDLPTQCQVIAHEISGLKIFGRFIRLREKNLGQCPEAATHLLIVACPLGHEGTTPVCGEHAAAIETGGATRCADHGVPAVVAGVMPTGGQL